MKIRSVSFDTSFVLKNSKKVDQVIKKLAHDRLPCFLPATVASELEQLKIWSRITNEEYTQAHRRLRQVHATLIDFKNRLLADVYGRICMMEMEKTHGIKPLDIRNDCSILVTTLKHGVDVFLSEDFHFTSKSTRDVIEAVSNAACDEYQMMCGALLISIDAETFLLAYRAGDIDLGIVETRIKNIRKRGKRLD